MKGHLWAKRALAALAVGAVVGLHWSTRATVPDDYDSLNFVLGIGDRFDMAILQPQFPGYPVFVALGKLIALAGLSPLTAATSISAVASGIAALALAACAQRLGGPRAAVATFGLAGVAWLPWLLGGSALSESLGAALVASAFACLPRWGGTPAAFLAGLSLGARASYWPLALVALVAAARANGRWWRVLAAGVAGAAVWLIPLAAKVGVAELWRLGRIHLAGHFRQWGGTVVTRPNLWTRLGAFGKGLFYVGLAPALWASLALAALVAFALWYHHRRGTRVAWKPLVLALAPYALWAFVAQNVVEQPRHLLPLVDGEIVWLGCLLADLAPLALAAGVAAVVVNWPLARARHAEPPAVLQAADWIAANEPVATTWLVGTRSPRLFRWRIPQFQTREHEWLSDVIVHLSRMDRFPEPVLLTSEVDLHSGLGERVPLPRRWKVEPVARFCRDARIDFRDPCLELRQLSWNP